MAGDAVISNLWNIFWIFLLLSMISPQLKMKMLENARLKLIRELEKKRGSRVICMIHRQETMNFLGIPIVKFIDIEDSERVLRAIHLTPKDMPIDLILHTPGGLVLAAEQIAMALKKHQAQVRVIVPHYAMSGGTLLALAADEILMDENAVLGPVDPQLGEFPAASIVKVAKEKDKNKLEDKTLILADISEKAIAQVKDFVYNLLKDKISEEKAKKIAEELSTGKWTHDYPITAEKARELGLPVKVGLPGEVYELMSLYPQPFQQRPSVQYIPVPYKTKEKGK